MSARLCINSGDLFDKLSPKDACAAIRAAGFDAIDWSLDAKTDQSVFEEQLAAITESGLSVAQASLSPLFLRWMPIVPRASLRERRR